jgi:hypothetical protein
VENGEFFLVVCPLLREYFVVSNLFGAGPFHPDSLVDGIITQIKTLHVYLLWACGKIYTRMRLATNM